MLLHSFKEIPVTYIKVGHFSPGIDSLFPNLGVYIGKRRIMQNQTSYRNGGYSYSEYQRKPQVKKILARKIPNLNTLFRNISPIFVSNYSGGDCRKVKNRICIQFLPESIVEVKMSK